MKRIIIYILILFAAIACISLILRWTINKKDNKTIKVAEVTHSVFYTPFYVAIENGYFKDLGIDIDLVLVSGSDNVAASVLSGDTEIGLAGPESAVYVYLGKEKDYLQIFSGLTKRDGQFILGRDDKEFSWTDLVGKEILIGRKTGMPALSFYKALENEGIDKNEVNINTSIEFAELSGAFIGGNGDYVNLFEPLASTLEKNKQGYVLQSVGASSNEFPYTAFYARKSSIENNKELYKSFAEAIHKGLIWTLNNDSIKVAKVIKNEFKDTSIADLKIMIDHYKEADVWLDSPKIKEEFFQTLIDLLKDNNLIKEKVDYKTLVNNLDE